MSERFKCGSGRKPPHVFVRGAGARRGRRFARRVIAGMAAEPPEAQLAIGLSAASLLRAVGVSLPARARSSREQCQRGLCRPG